VVEAHDGRVTVTSRVDEGSEFTVALPKEKRAPEARPKAAEAETADDVAARV
jgi:light-regulated signal transduction histidine kinase (bacteriophytochrome)